MESAVITEARADADYQEARDLFGEYAQALGIDLEFQGFASELKGIREMYGPPRGCLLLARLGGRVVGCVALRPREGRVCEMKRLYVRPAARGSRAGRLLALALIARAQSLGYERMVLDTLPSMRTAQALYATLGFRETAPYYDSPIEGTTYMELDLRAEAESGDT